MDDSRTVWCGNLSDKVTEELLYELFLQAAPLERVKIPSDKEGRRLNYGFVTMKHECSVPYAAQLLNGTPFFDKIMHVRPRNPNNQNHAQNQIQNQIHNQIPNHNEPQRRSPQNYSHREISNDSYQSNRHGDYDRLNDYRHDYRHKNFSPIRHDNYNRHRESRHRDYRKGRNNQNWHEGHKRY